MRVCMIGKFDPDYARHAIIRTGLEQAGCQVLLQRYSKRLSAAALIPRLARDMPRLAPQTDVFLFPAFNRLQAPPMALMARLVGRPAWLDYMVGLADADEDRGRASALKRRFYRQVDRLNTRLIPCFTDTAAHREALAHLLAQPMDHVAVVPVGAREELLDFRPAKPRPIDPVVALYVGTYIPFHGTDVILRAAALLREEAGIAFELIGEGQTFAQARALADALGVRNVTFRPGFFPTDDLLPLLAHGSIYLGAFGDTGKTRYVVPNKVFDGLALGLPVLTADSPAIREFFTPGQHLAAVPPGDPVALAEAIRRLAASPDERARLGRAGRARIREAFLPEHIGRQLRALFERSLPTSR